MAPQHVHGQDVLVQNFLRPTGQRVGIAPLQGVNQQPRQEEIVYSVALGGQFLIDFLTVGGVDFRQQRHAVGVGQHLQPRQNVPSTRLVQEVVLPHRLVGIGEGIQPHNARAVPGQRVQRVAVKFPHERRSNIQIHLPQIPAAGFQQVGQFAAQQLPAAQLQFRRALARLQLDLQAFGQSAGGLVLHAQGRHQFPRIRARVVHLLVECVPVGFFGAIGHTHHQNG